MSQLHKRTAAVASSPAAVKPKGGYTQEEIAKWETAKEVMAAEWSPSTVAALRLFLAVQLVASLYSYISDCDEVFNYWEPTHFLQYGRALQTWEYRCAPHICPRFCSTSTSIGRAPICSPMFSY